MLDGAPLYKVLPIAATRNETAQSSSRKIATIRQSTSRRFEVIICLTLEGREYHQANASHLQAAISRTQKATCQSPHQLEGGDCTVQTRAFGIAWARAMPEATDLMCRLQL